MAPPSPSPRFSVFIASSLDGYIARSDGSLDWLSAVESSGVDFGYWAFFEAVDTIVVGRKTYDTVLGFAAWPYQGKRCIVLSHRPSRAQAIQEAAGEISAWPRSGAIPSSSSVPARRLRRR